MQHRLLAAHYQKVAEITKDFGTNTLLQMKRLLQRNQELEQESLQHQEQLEETTKRLHLAELARLECNQSVTELSARLDQLTRKYNVQRQEIQTERDQRLGLCDQYSQLLVNWKSRSLYIHQLETKLRELTPAMSQEDEQEPFQGLRDHYPSIAFPTEDSPARVETSDEEEAPEDEGA